MTTILTSDEAMEEFRGYLVMGSGLANDRVLYYERDEMDAPRTALPYMTIERLSDMLASGTPQVQAIEPDPLGTPPYDHEQWVTQDHDLTVNVRVFGDGATLYANQIRLAKLRIDVMAALLASGIAVRQASDVLDTTLARSTQWEIASSVDWVVRYTSRDVSDVGIIETVVAPVNE